MNGSLQDLGKLILRVVLGGLLLFHGLHKAMYGVGFIQESLVAHGLPAWLTYGVFLGEVVGPILLILGLFARIGALFAAGNMIVAVYLMHTRQFFTLASSGGWSLELQAFYFFTALAVILLGAGRFSLGGARGRWN